MRNFKLRWAFLGAVSILSLLEAKASILLTDFGSAGPSAFSVVDSTFAYTQNAHSLYINGSDLSQFTGALALGTGDPRVVDISADHSQMRLEGSAVQSPTSSFSIMLYDSTFTRTAEFGGGSWVDLKNNLYTQSFSLGVVSSGFDWTTISGIQLLTGGSPADPKTIDATITGLYAGVSAVPEPSSFLAFAGLGLFGFVGRRVRRSAVKA